MNNTAYISVPATQIPVSKEVEVLVLGAGPAGCAAAIMAARTGAKTLLVDAQNAPGGMSTTGMMSHYTGTVDSKLYAVGYEPGQVTLNFDVEPTKITVYRYDVEVTAETAGEEIIMDNGSVLDLSFGNYLYHIAAEWDYPDNELGGSGDYAFYTKAPEIYNP